MCQLQLGISEVCFPLIFFSLAMKSIVFVDMMGLISIYHTGIIHIQRFTPLSNAISLQIDFQNMNYGVTISFKTSTAFEKAASLLDFTLAVNYKSTWNTVI